MDQYYQLPKEPLIKLIVSMTNLDVLNILEWKNVLGLKQDVQLTMKQLHKAYT